VLAAATRGATDPPQFREVLVLAGARFDADRSGYAVGADAGVPLPTGLADAELRGLPDHPGARQCTHVTFGSVVSDTELGPALRDALATSSELYADALAEHFGRHLALLGTNHLA
jgi:tagaturonate epimerase